MRPSRARPPPARRARLAGLNQGRSQKSAPCRNPCCASSDPHPGPAARDHRLITERRTTPPPGPGPATALIEFQQSRRRYCSWSRSSHAPASGSNTAAQPQIRETASVRASRLGAFPANASGRSGDTTVAQPLAARAKPVSTGASGRLDPAGDPDPGRSAEMRACGEYRGPIVGQAKTCCAVDAVLRSSGADPSASNLGCTPAAAG